MISPAAIRGSQLFFCSSLPPWSSALVRISGRVISEPAAASEARESSSVVRIMARLPSSEPPIGLGHREAEVAELGHLRDEGLRNQRVAAVDPLGLRRHLALGELAHRRAHLLRELVERQPIATARGSDVAPDLAQHGLAAGAAQAVAHARREGVFQRGVAEPELERARRRSARAGCAPAAPRRRRRGSRAALAAAAVARRPRPRSRRRPGPRGPRWRRRPRARRAPGGRRSRSPCAVISRARASACAIRLSAAVSSRRASSRPGREGMGSSGDRRRPAP